MKISAVIPTIDGREESFDRTIESLKETTECEIELLVIHNAETVGEGWDDGANDATGDYIWLGADDVEFEQGWLEAAVDACERGVYPTPIKKRPDGSIEECGSLGQGAILSLDMQDGIPTGNSPFPFFKRDNWHGIGPCPNIHYYADDYLCFKARRMGLRSRLVRGYTLIHHEGTVGRAKMVRRAMEDRQTFIRTIEREFSCQTVSL